MTYGVPYSFVPGTKAKAEEVNANFLDVLDKISDTNTKIDTANSQINTDISDLDEKLDEELETKADTDLSNLSTTGQAIINNKADVSLLDGVWVSKFACFASDVALAATGTHQYSLASYLPEEPGIYEVWIDGWMAAINKTYDYSHFFMHTDCNQQICMAMAVTKDNRYDFGTYSTSLLFGTGRTLYVYNAGVLPGNYTVRLSRYRKVR